MWRAITRVWANAFFGLVTFSFSKLILLIAAAAPSVHIPGSLNTWAVGDGVLVFLGLLLRDLASGINRKRYTE